MDSITVCWQHIMFSKVLGATLVVNITCICLSYVDSLSIIRVEG